MRNTNTITFPLVIILLFIGIQLGNSYKANKAIKEMTPVEVPPVPGWMEKTPDNTPIEVNEDEVRVVEQKVYATVAEIVKHIPIYGMSELDTNVLISSQYWNGNLQTLVETTNFTNFIFINNRLDKIVVTSAVPEGAFEQRFTSKQKSDAMSTLYNVPNRVWKDEEVIYEFLRIATAFNADIHKIKIERTPVNISKSIQHIEKPPFPGEVVSGPDAFIAIKSATFEVTFRTEKVDQDYRLAVVKLLNF